MADDDSANVNSSDNSGVANPLDDSGLRAILGLTIGNAAVSVPENWDKQGVGVKKNFTSGGATVALEYVLPLTRRFAVGLEGGVFLGQNRAKANVGTNYAANSLEFQRTTAAIKDLFAVMGSNIAAAARNANFINLGGGGGGGGAVVDAIEANVFARFSAAMRYLGGSGEAPDVAFLTEPEHAGGIFIFDGAIDDVNPNATLANFLVGHAVNPLEAFGGRNMEGINRLREIITTHYPSVASFLQHIRPVAPPANIPVHTSDTLMQILTGRDSTGRPFGADLTPLTDLTNEQIDAALQPFFSGVLAEISKAAESGKPSFGVCPHLALKLRWYSLDLAGIIYLKVGLTRQSGVAHFDNGLAPRSFNKISPILGLGVEKKLNANGLAISFEVLKILPANANVCTVRLLGKNVTQKVKLQDTRIVVQLVYNIPTLPI